MRKWTTANLIADNLVVIIAFLVLIGGSAALAQNNTRSGNSATSGTSGTSSGSGGPLSAPVGHRQPRAGDVPNEKGVTKLDAEDAALDRKIKSICRGC
jgi:hypothetical protein